MVFCAFLFSPLKKGGIRASFWPSVQLQNSGFSAIIHPVLILAWILCVHLCGVIRFAVMGLSVLLPVALAQEYTLGVGGVGLESGLEQQLPCL